MASTTRDIEFFIGEDGADSRRELAIEFVGSSKEYFRIWAVNLCLTLLTLGVFSAWAKVRKKRYFYSNTILDGTPFQYLARPLPILKGRLIAAVLFLFYYFSSNLYTAILPFVLFAGMLIAPWVIVRSAAFNARYTAFRNMTFNFDAGYWDAFRVILWFGLVPVLYVATFFQEADQLIWVYATVFSVASLTFPWWIRNLKNLIVTHTAFGSKSAKFEATGGSFFRIYFYSGLIMAAFGALATALIVVFSGDDFDPTSKAIYLMSLPIYGGYVVAYAYVMAGSSNLVWNKTRLGSVSFRSNLKPMGLAGLYLGNAAGIIVSLGLLTPWAVIRTLKYRVDHLRVATDSGLEQFQGSNDTNVQAAGAELGEFFDLDLSL